MTETQDTVTQATDADWLVLAGIFGFNEAQLAHLKSAPGHAALEALNLITAHRLAAEAAQRERDAVIAENWNGPTRDGDTIHIAQAIRSATT